MKKEQKSRLKDAKQIVEEVVAMLEEEQGELDTDTQRGENRDTEIDEETHYLGQIVEVIDCMLKGKEVTQFAPPPPSPYVVKSRGIPIYCEETYEIIGYEPTDDE